MSGTHNVSHGPSFESLRLVNEMIGGYFKTQLIYVTVMLDIPEMLKDSPKTPDDLIKLVGERFSIQPSVLRRVLRGLVFVKILRRQREKLCLTELGECLLRDVPNSLRGIALFEAKQTYHAFGELPNMIKTGKIGFEQAFKRPFFDHLAQNPEDAQEFNELMRSMSYITAQDIVEAHDFSSVGKVVDVGGGNGILLTTLLAVYPHLRGVLFETATLEEEATTNLTKAGLLGRCEFVPGDFFEAVPEGGDVYIVSQILHDWNDEQATRILDNCATAMKGQGKLLILEYVMPPEPMASHNDLVIRDLMMMVLLDGKERTESEFRDLLKASGYELHKVITTKNQNSLLEAIPLRKK